MTKIRLGGDKRVSTRAWLDWRREGERDGRRKKSDWEQEKSSLFKDGRNGPWRYGIGGITEDDANGVVRTGSTGSTGCTERAKEAGGSGTSHMVAACSRWR